MHKAWWTEVKVTIWNELGFLNNLFVNYRCPTCKLFQNKSLFSATYLLELNSDSTVSNSFCNFTHFDIAQLPIYYRQPHEGVSHHRNGIWTWPSCWSFESKPLKLKPTFTTDEYTCTSYQAKGMRKLPHFAELPNLT